MTNLPSPTRRCRRFDPVDAMILVAATVLGVWLMPTGWWAMVRSSWFSGRNPYHEAATMLLRSSCPIPMCWTLAAGLIRLRRPRPVLPRLGRQPGAVATLAATLMIGYELVALTIQGAAIRFRPNPFESGFFTLINEAAPAVAGAWLALGVGGRWRPEPGWIDRLGRALGWAWIAWYVLQQILMLTFPF